MSTLSLSSETHEGGLRYNYRCYEPLCGCWELNSGPSEEQPVLLTTKPSLQPQEQTSSEIKTLKTQTGYLVENIPGCRQECSELELSTVSEFPQFWPWTESRYFLFPEELHWLGQEPGCPQTLLLCLSIFLQLRTELWAGLSYILPQHLVFQ